jgi:cyanamide hydratase
MMPGSANSAGMSANGWAAVPRSFAKSLANVDQAKQAKLSVEDVKLPNSNIANKTYAFAKEQLPGKTFNHSMRVVYFGKPQASL